MSTTLNNQAEMSAADVQHEIDEVNALFEDMNEEEEVSWMAEIGLNDSKNQSLQPASNSLLDSSFDGFDTNCGDTWVFPLGFEKRDYQLNISRNTLFNNTLVILPTGLGKTFIASVTIYNFLRWYPKSKIIFMAPTRPLVNQQISACYDVVGIPKSETAEMTGKILKKDRKNLWDSKKVFFATPQIICSDMADGIFPAHLVKLLIFDEAHKAKGDYAYCTVIKQISRVQKNFRVLALTATAGKSSDVIQIIQNLLISKIEYRTEASIDVKPYTHKKQIKTICVQLTSELQEIHDTFLEFVNPIIKELRDNGHVKAFSISKGYLIMEQKKVRENTNMNSRDKGTIMSNISAAIGFYHSLEILQRHSVHLFLKSLRDDNNKTSYKFFISRDFKLTQYIKQLDEKYEPHNPFNININPLPNGEVPSIVDRIIDFGHPKFDILKKKLLEYFDTDGAKAIIFCEYRDTTVLISKMLHQLAPRVRARCLIGQGGNISQKDQLRIMKEFREGDINTLVCTSVAEEGLDIGAVDLVICFDISSKNATRFVQRIGRTARKRTGQVIVLATEGREMQMIKELISNKDSINKSISRNKDISNHFYKAPRLVPSNFNPKCIETKFVIAVDDEVEAESGKKSKKKPKEKKATKKSSKLKVTTSKESIVDHFKPTNKRKISTELEIETIVEVVDKPSSQKAIANEINDDEDCADSYMNKINQFIKDNELEENSFLKDLIEYRAREGMASIKQLAKSLVSPSKQKNMEEFAHIKFDPIDEMDLATIEVYNPPAKRAKKDLNDSNHYGNQFDVEKTAVFVPCTSIFNNSLDFMQSKDLNGQCCSPLLAQFQKQQKKMSSSTPMRKIPSKQRINPIFLSQTPSEAEAAQSQSNVDIQEQKTQPIPIRSDDHTMKSEKFPFLGIASISDIFEGCDTNVDFATTAQNDDDEDDFEKSPRHNYEDEIEKSIEKLRNDISECSLDENGPMEVNEHIVFKKLNLDDVLDLFDQSNDAIMTENIDEHSNSTENYDVDEEMSRVEQKQTEKSFKFKENSMKIQSCDENDENCFKPPVKSIQARPNFSNLLAAIKSDQIFTTQRVLCEQNVNIMKQYPPTNAKTPQKSEIIIADDDSTPELVFPKRRVQVLATQSPVTSRFNQHQSDSDDFKSPVPLIRKLPMRRRKRKNTKFGHNSFLCTQAAVSDGGSSDEHENDLTTLGGFIHNETIHTQHERSTMYAKYVQSLESPNAPRNVNVFKRELPAISLSQIFSQMPHEDEENDDDGSDLGSFINDDDVIDDQTEEIDELELAEMRLKEERRRKRRLREGDIEDKSSKKRKVIRNSNSSSEDEELKKLRTELDM